MSKFLNIQGQIVEAAKSGLSVQNRAFKFGDGLFETIRVINGKPLFIEDHYSRLVRGMNTLEYDLPANWDQAFFKKEILKVVEANEVTTGGRVRFSLFRKGEGRYTPKSNETGFVIEADGGESNSFILNEQGHKLGIFEEIRLPINKLSPLKTNNALPYVLAGMYAAKKGFDDVIILNEKNQLCEAVSSNIFLLIDGILYTPAIKDGCTAGIMRKKVIQICNKINISVVETSISHNLLEDASEVFMSNAINGLRWVQSYQKKRYFHKVCDQLVAELNKLT